MLLHLPARSLHLIVYLHAMKTTAVRLIHLDITIQSRTNGLSHTKVGGNNFGNGGNCNNGVPPFRSTPIMLLEVSRDGMSSIGNAVPILDRSDLDGPLVEAHSIACLGGRYFLF